MPKLTLPVQAFIENYCRQAFPNRNFSRGSAVNDLLIKPMALLLQPLRHELDGVKVAQSLANYAYMSAAELDALASNWGKFRQTGGRSQGTLRLYFDTAQDYQLNYLEFVGRDGSVYLLSAPVRVTQVELLKNRVEDGGQLLYTADVTVVSQGLGSRYAAPADTITVVRQGPPNLIRVSNPDDFAVTSPNETNYDVVNSMFRTLGLRNRVGKASIRGAIFDVFPGVLDVFVAGADHAKMLRDVQAVRINGADVELHLGGMTDVWLNTLNVQRREQLFSYLPTSRRLRLVSGTMAADLETLYTFSRMLLTVEGEFTALDHPANAADESAALQFMQGPLAITAYVLNAPTYNRQRVAASDVVAGDGLIALPAPDYGDAGTARGHVFVDMLSPSFAVTGAKAGDAILVGDALNRITRVTGRAIEMGPARSTVVYLTYAGPTLAVGPLAQRVIPVAALGDIKRGQRLIVDGDAASGHYRVLDTTPTSVTVGNVLASVTTAAGVLVEPGVYDYLIPASAVPLEAGPTCWLIAGSEYQQIVSVTRASGGVTIRVSGATSAPAGAKRLLQGLRGSLLAGAKLLFEQDVSSSVPPGTTTPYAATNTRYANALAENWPLALQAPLQITSVAEGADFVATVVQPAHGYSAGQPLTLACSIAEYTGTFNLESVTTDTYTFRFTAGANPGSVTSGITAIANRLRSPGLGAVAQRGDLLVFDGSGLMDEISGAQHGGDGKRLTLAVNPIDRDTIEVTPPIALIIPAGTAYALQANQTVLGTKSVASATGSSLQVTGWDVGATGLGDGVGMVLRALGTSTPHTVIRSSIVTTRKLRFTPAKPAVLLTFGTDYLPVTNSDLDSTVTQRVTTTDFRNGRLVGFDNALKQWTVVPNNASTDIFVAAAPAELVGGRGGTVSAVAPASDWGYYEPVVGDIGSTVRQGTFRGQLVAVGGDPLLDPEWEVAPQSDADTFDDLEALVWVDTGTGLPSYQAKQGTLAEAASAPHIAKSGNVVFTLDRPWAGPAAPTTVEVLSRYGTSGCFFDASLMRLSHDAVINPSVFSGVQPTAQSGGAIILPIVGANAGRVPVDSVSTGVPFEVGAFGESEVVGIPHAPQDVVFNAGAAAGVTALAIPGSSLGYWAHAGRLLEITIGSTVTYLESAGRGSSDDEVLLRDPLAFPIAANAQVAVRVVEGFVTPFLLVPNVALRSYRVTRTPVVGEVQPLGASLTLGADGSYSASDIFTSASVSFQAVVGNLDYAARDAFLTVLGGSDASPTPRAITGLSSALAVTTDPGYAGAADAVPFFVTKQPTRVDQEFWMPGALVNQTTVRVDAGFAVAAAMAYASGESFGLVFEMDRTSTAVPAGARAVFFGPFPVTGVSGQDITIDTTTGMPMTIGGVIDTTSPTPFDASLLNIPLRASLRLFDRVMAINVDGHAANTFNYYSGGFMSLPLVRVVDVQLMSSDGQQALRSLPWALDINDPALRYSAAENIDLIVDDETAILQPVRVTYLCDPSIEAVNAFLNDPETRVANANQMAKRMETVSVNLTFSARTELSTDDVSLAVARWINTRPSTQRISKDALVQMLYDQKLVTSVDVTTIRLDAEYLAVDGTTVLTDVAEVFGADTACYVAGTILVNKVLR